MSDFFIIIDTDHQQVESARVMTVPLAGSGPANELVLIDGIAVTNLDTDMDLKTRDERQGFIFIHTNFRLRDADTFVDAATWISLASISADDSTDVLFAVDSVFATPDANGRIMITAQVVVAGDIGLNRLAYQVNVLVNTPSPSLARQSVHIAAIPLNAEAAPHYSLKNKGSVANIHKVQTALICGNSL